MIKEALHEVINGKDLDYEMAAQVMKEIMSGEANEVEMASYLTALRMKGESIDEITASAKIMREMAATINPPFPVMDSVGTGGDEVGTFNISTTSAFIIAAAGVPVAKHGNRSVSSKSGAADVLESLGINLGVSLQADEETLEETKMCFLFAQTHHSSMKNVAPVRKKMGERTLFNVLGPLSNPANASMQLLGVYDEALIEPLAKVLSNLGVVRGMVVCGNDGLDEVTLTGPTKVCEIRDGKLSIYEVTPEQFGFEPCELKDLIGGTPEDNAEITKAILSGKELGAKKNVVAMNAGIAIYLGKDGFTLEDGVREALEIIESGKGMEKLLQFKKVNQDKSK